MSLLPNKPVTSAMGTTKAIGRLPLVTLWSLAFRQWRKCVFAALKRERLAIALSAESVVWAQLSGWWHAQVGETDVFSVATGSANSPDLSGPASPSQADWQSVLSMLETAFIQSEIGQAWQLPRADIILSNRFVRVTLIPWASGLQNQVDVLVLARAQLEAHYGAMPEWTVQVDATAWGQPIVVCALETALIGGLRRLCERHRVRCRTLQPYFTVCWNRWKTHWAKHEQALFAVVEGGTLTVASITEQRCHSLRQLTLGSQAELTDAVALLKREAVLQGLSLDTALFLHAPMLAKKQQGLMTGLTLLTLPETQPWPIAMALSGAV